MANKITKIASLRRVRPECPNGASHRRRHIRSLTKQVPDECAATGGKVGVR